MRQATYSFDGTGRNGACRSQSRRRKRHAIVTRSRASAGFTSARSESERESWIHFIQRKIAGREGSINSRTPSLLPDAPFDGRNGTAFIIHVALFRDARHQ